MLLIFCTKDLRRPYSMHMIHSMKMVANPSPSGNYVKQMDLDMDLEGTMLNVRLKSSHLYQINLIKRDLYSSFVNLRVNNYDQKINKDEKDSISKFKWMSRMNCYAEGTKKGYLRIRDIWNDGECLF